MKSEPDVFSLQDLVQRKGEPWDGVRNYQARNYLRSMEPGDSILFYHSNCTPPGVAGTCRITASPRPDPTQFEVGHKYWDPSSPPENPRWWLVDVGKGKVFHRFVSLDELKERPELTDMALVRRGNRLSVMPVTEQQFALICALGKRKTP